MKRPPPPTWWTWWKSPYSDAFMFATAALNVYTGITADSTMGAAVSWFCVGLMVATIAANMHIRGYQKLVAKMQHLLEQQQEMIQEIGKIKTDEIAHLIEADIHARMTGERPKPVTKH